MSASTAAAPPRDRLRVLLAATAVGYVVLSVLLLLAYYSPTQKPLVGDEFGYHTRALAQLAGEAVPNAYVWPPGQSAFLAAIYRVAGAHVLAVQLVQIALLAFAGVLAWRTWRAIDGARAATWATALLLLNPSTLAYADWLWPEVTHLACLLAAVWLLVVPARRAGIRALLAGALVGLALLLKSLLAAFWPFFLILLIRREDGARWRLPIGAAALYLLGLALATAPTLGSAYRDVGQPIIADSSLYNLDVGLRDAARSDYVDEAGAPAMQAFLASGATPQARNAAYRDKVLATVEQRGLGTLLAERLSHQYFRLFSAKTLLVSQSPGAACEGRLGAYGPSARLAVLDALAVISHAATLVLAALGIATWRRWKTPFGAFVALFFAYQLALYLGLHVMARYLVPMLPFLCGFGGAFAASLRRDDAGQAIAATPGRLAIGAALAALLLFLAFAGPWLDGRCG